jgi:transposase
MGTRHGDLDKRIRHRPAKANQLILVDEAGPCGSWLSRALGNQGDAGWVDVPARLPTKAGARVQPDRRDAVQLARLMRSGHLTPVAVPSVADEARRDPSRARDDVMRDRKAAQFRLNALLRRHDSRDPGLAPRRGLAEVGCAPPAQHLVFQA